MAIIAISRGTFSGGDALARLVGSQLAYPVVSREEIISSTDWFGISLGVAGQDESNRTSYWNRLAGEREAYRQSFQVALCERIIRGNLVYHGHAGHLLIPDVPVLRVRVVADMEYRIASVMRDQGISREEAASYIGRVDAERREWVRYLYGVEWDDSGLYDVVLNLSHLGLDSAASTIVHMSRLEEFAVGRRALEVIEDTILAGRINSALARSELTAGAGLKVKARQGTVIVSGTASQELLASLPALTAGVEGIKEIRYEVEVAPR